MKNLILTLFITILLVGLFITGCSNNNAAIVKADLNQEFRLPVGQTATINGEDLSIMFKEVTNDSRCPTGVTCIWAGEAKCQTEVKFKGNSSSLILTISGSSNTPTVFESYTFTSNVEPYPKAEQTIDKNSYVLILKVTK